jgi:hypothetical protein
MVELEDAGTIDVLTEISRGVDKYPWFVEAHQHKSDTDVIANPTTPHPTHSLGENAVFRDASRKTGSRTQTTARPT